MERDDDALKGLMMGGFGLFILGLLIAGPLRVLWVATQPADSPTTTISLYLAPVANARSGNSYIDVGAKRYECMGAVAPEGTVVLYDPQTPNRCRKPEDLWRMTDREKRSGSLILVVALVPLSAAVVAFLW